MQQASIPQFFFVFFVFLELAGVNCAEWNSLFNGQLDDVNSLDPMTGVQNSDPTPMLPANTQQAPHIDRLGEKKKIMHYLWISLVLCL